VKVLGMANAVRRLSWWNGDVIDMIARRQPGGVPGAYAVYAWVPDGTAHIRRADPYPSRQALTVGAYDWCSGGENEAPALAVIKRWPGAPAQQDRAGTIHPPRFSKSKSDDIVSFHRVVGSGEA